MNESDRAQLALDLDRVEDEMDDLVQEKAYSDLLADLAVQSLHAKRYEMWHVNNKYYYTLLMFPQPEDLEYFLRTGCKMCSPVSPDPPRAYLLAGHVKESEITSRGFAPISKL